MSLLNDHARLVKPPKRAAANTMPIRKACVLGSGAFGTAIGTLFARIRVGELSAIRSATVKIHHLNADEALVMNSQHENVYFLKGCPLPPNLSFTDDVAEALEGSDIIAVAVPTQYLRSFLEKNKPIFAAFFKKNPNTPILVGSKGIEEKSLMFPTEIVVDVLKDVLPGGDANNNIAVLAGPNFAGEIARKKFSASTIAASDIRTARRIQSMLMSSSSKYSKDAPPTFRVYASTDVIGCEVASAVKNVIAIAAGAMKGLGQQQNCRAALICRGLAEITHLVDHLGGTGYALQGLAGIGDLLLTCSSEESRNFSVGVRLGSGETMKEIMDKKTGGVAEGVATVRALKALVETRIGASHFHTMMPICEAVYKVVHEGAAAKDLFYRAVVEAPLADEIHCIGALSTNTSTSASFMGAVIAARVETLKARKELNNSKL